MGAGKISHFEDFLNDFKKNFLNTDFSDVIFIVDGRRFECHKAILASRSEYFKSLLFGGFKEGNQPEIEVKNINADAFYAILHYFYSGEIDLTTLEINIVLEILKSSHEWQLTKLLKSVREFLESNINLQNFSSIWDYSNTLDISELHQKVGLFCDSNVERILKNSSTFNHLHPNKVLELLKRESFREFEENVFNAVAIWSKNAPTEERNLILNEIQLHLLDPLFLLQNVKESGLFPIEKIVEAVTAKLIEVREANSKVILNENLATLANGATLIQGNDDDALNGNCDNSGFNFTYHKPNESIIISLKENYILDNIQFKLYEGDDDDNDNEHDEFKYKLEVGLDNVNWNLIADNSDNYCKSWQKFTFPERPIKFIKITGYECVYENSIAKDPNPLYISFIEASLKRSPFHY